MRESSTRHLTLPSVDETEALGAALSAALPADSSGMLILLQGELGSGKSTLVRAMLGSMGHAGSVPSPTYTLVEPYEVSGKTIYHIDLYRVSDSEELTYLGWDDLRDGLILLEWPERSPALFDLADLKIELRYKGDGRTAAISSFTDRGAALLAALMR